MSDSTGVKVMILDREYQVGCPEEERQGLLDAARYLDDKMREMRNRSNSLGADKIAVVTALNITYDMLKLQSSQNAVGTMRDTITALSHSIDDALAEE